jgi:hypothetical protein
MNMTKHETYEVVAGTRIAPGAVVKTFRSTDRASVRVGGPATACLSRFSPMIRALSIQEPWASLIESGRKTVEFRSWKVNYRGPLLVLAAKHKWRGAHSWPIGARGVSRCVVDLVDIRPAVPSDAESGCIWPEPEHDGALFAWVLSNPRPVAQVPVKGQLGIFKPSDAVLAAIGL